MLIFGFVLTLDNQEYGGIVEKLFVLSNAFAGFVGLSALTLVGWAVNQCIYDLSAEDTKNANECIGESQFRPRLFTNFTLNARIFR